MTITIITSQSGNGKLLIRTGECNQCGECCKTLNITVVRDVTLNQHRSIKELELYLGYRGIRLVGENIKATNYFIQSKFLANNSDPRMSAK